jgi:hypothetical protein
MAMIEQNLAAINERIAELSKLRRQLRRLLKNPVREKPGATPWCGASPELPEQSGH